MYALRKKSPTHVQKDIDRGKATCDICFSFFYLVNLQLSCLFALFLLFIFVYKLCLLHLFDV